MSKALDNKVIYPTCGAPLCEPEAKTIHTTLALTIHLFNPARACYFPAIKEDDHFGRYIM